MKQGTSPFVCACRTQVAETVFKAVYTKRILVHFCVVGETVCKSSAHDTTLKIEVILFLLHDERIQTSCISCLPRQNASLTILLTATVSYFFTIFSASIVIKLIMEGFSEWSACKSLQILLNRFHTALITSVWRI